MKKIIDVELFTQDKSCEQGCSHCPLSVKHNDGTHQKVDKVVVNSFKQLQHVLRDQGYLYNLHMGSKLETLPRLTYPEGVAMVRHETNKKIINASGGVSYYSNALYRLFQKNKNLQPTEICFSYVPENPILADTEKDIIVSLMQEIAQWYRKIEGGKKVISCTIRSNNYPAFDYNNLKKHLLQEDSMHIDDILTKIGIKKHKQGEFYDSTDDYGSYYLNERLGTTSGITYKISNRVIAHTSKKERVISSKDKNITLDHHQIQAIGLSDKKNSLLDVMLDPSGIMINHTTIAINNPIMWMTHKDFLQNLKSAENIKNTLYTAIDENIYLYEIYRKYLADQKDGIQNLAKNDWLQIFEENRQSFRKRQADIDLT